MDSKAQLEQAYAYASSILNGDGSGHGMDHIDRVLANARLLLSKTAGADALIVLTAATLHDTYDEKLVADKVAARGLTQAKLQELMYTQAQIDEILAIIDQMSFSYGLDHDVHLDVNGQLVQDADRLDAIGAIGIARAFAYGGAKGRPLDDGQGARSNLSSAEYHKNAGGTIQHFHEKLLGIAGTLNTPAAREIGRARTRVLRDFLDEFEAEVEGNR
ncbi:HD domain-containing protein [Lacticaseibacillus hulanensis]|jgi:uncharacterized protein|uniref:HD domain-containing protein n=1 Tax=Lacticaseibacillus hulanensis TaxID=2493111 RepID=UPI000FDA6AF8|nr:phosphohydrolase [Lacticaseibacillus hulanensis]